MNDPNRPGDNTLTGHVVPSLFVLGAVAWVVALMSLLHVWFPGGLGS